MKAIAQQQRAPGIVEGLPKWLGAALSSLKGLALRCLSF